METKNTNETKNNLRQLGWNDFFDEHLRNIPDNEYNVARVAIEHRNMYSLCTELGELDGILSGKFRHRISIRSEYPAVGDWVLYTPQPEEGRGVIHGLLPRKSRFSRNVVGRSNENAVAVGTGEQIVAANVDTVFLVSSLNKELNVRRVERYLTMAWESGATPVIVLNKADLCDNPDEKVADVEAVAWGVPIYSVSALEQVGIGNLEEHLGIGKTVAVIGSSGVGKSTLINAIIGREAMETSTIGSYKDKGQHTTTHRELILMGERGIIIDTPGMREIQLWDGAEGASKVFADIEEMLGACRFPDCKHESEPGCAIVEAIEAGTLDEGRYQSYLKLQREIRFHEAKQQKAEERRQSKAAKNPYDKRERKRRFGE